MKVSGFIRKNANAVLCTVLLYALMGAFPAIAGEQDSNIPETEQALTEALPVMIPAPDYSKVESWVSMPEETVHEADAFFILPTVNLKETEAGNEDIYDEEKALRFVKTFGLEKGIVTESADVYAPYYRQATLPCYVGSDGLLHMEHPEGMEDFFETAYSDIHDAWLYYTENCSSDRPVVLFGYSQGAEMVLRLLAEFGEDQAFSDRLVAAYVIACPVDEAFLSEHPYLHMAGGETDTGGIISFNAYDERAEKNETRCFTMNPLNWKTDSTPAGREENLGYVVADTWGEIKEEEPAYCGAFIDEETGMLILTECGKIDELYETTGGLFPKGDYHLYDLNLFYRNLESNIAARIENFTGSEDSAER